MISKIYKSTGSLLEVRWAKEIAKRRLEKEQLAQDMILNPTNLELLLEFRLKYVVNGRLLVYKQVVLFGYIVDFYIPKLLLAIEADGPRHHKTEIYDHERDNNLSLRGIKTARFTSEFLGRNSSRTIDDAIRKVLNERRAELTTTPNRSHDAKVEEEIQGEHLGNSESKPSAVIGDLP